MPRRGLRPKVHRPGTGVCSGQKLLELGLKLFNIACLLYARRGTMGTNLPVSKRFPPRDALYCTFTTLMQIRMRQAMQVCLQNRSQFAISGDEVDLVSQIWHRIGFTSSFEEEQSGVHKLRHVS